MGVDALDQGLQLGGGEGLGGGGGAEGHAGEGQQGHQLAGAAGDQGHGLLAHVGGGGIVQEVQAGIDGAGGADEVVAEAAGELGRQVGRRNGFGRGGAR
jgi:hypothetical protein